jgi:hypothetical protein
MTIPVESGHQWVLVRRNDSIDELAFYLTYSPLCQLPTPGRVTLITNYDCRISLPLSRQFGVDRC